MTYNSAHPSFHLITFGCQMNVRDSQWLASILENKGYIQTEFDNAHIILINTCSVREKPEQKIYSVLRRISQSRRQDIIVGILGCAAQQIGHELFAKHPYIKLIAGGDSIWQVPDALDSLAASPKAYVELLDFSDIFHERQYDRNNLHSAYVNIMQGCDNFCSFCIVPFTRGRQRSRDGRAILEECYRRVEDGAMEITLLGQNVNAWGKDSGDCWDFSRLLENISRIPGLARLRYVSANPRDMTQTAIEAFGKLPNLCPRLHLPLQSGSDKVLKKMRRGYDVGTFIKLIEALHAARSDIALSTDLIVGFPGETEEDFQATLELMKKCRFMSSFSFCYSDRPGTRASLMQDKIEEGIKHERLERLQEIQEELGQSWLKNRVGEETEILIEGKSAKEDSEKPSFQGRDPYGMIVNVEVDKEILSPLIKVRITEAKKHSLKGIAVNI